MVYILLFYVLYIRIVFLCNVITLLFLCFLIPLPPLLISVSTIFPQAFKQNCFYNFLFMIHRIRHQSRDYYREKSFLLHTYTFLCEHSRKKASFYHEFFTAKKISLSLFPCTPPSRCKRWSLSILSFCPSPICYFSFIFAYTPKRRLLPRVFLFIFLCNWTPQFRVFYCTIFPAHLSQQ